MAVIDEALVSLAEAKTYLGISVDTWDDQLESLINGISLSIASMCSPRRLIIADLTEDYSGGRRQGLRGGVKRMQLNSFPINSVVSITDDDSETVPAADYVIVGDMGWLEHDGVFPVPEGRWSVAYNAGLWADETEVPWNVKLGALKWINRSWAGSKMAQSGVKSEKVGAIAIAYQDDGGVPNEVMIHIQEFVAVEV